jgi:hypothetical protein
MIFFRFLRSLGCGAASAIEATGSAGGFHGERHAAASRTGRLVLIAALRIFGKFAPSAPLGYAEIVRSTTL